MKPKQNIYIISDNHFNHPAIIKLAKRKFKTIDQMESFMIQKWNMVVKPNDLVICLGDLIFTKGKSARLKEIIKILNGRIILVSGNHDRKPYAWYLSNGIDFIAHNIVWEFNKKKILFIHNPHEVKKPELSIYDYVIHGHQHNSTPFIQKKRCCLFINVSSEHLNYTPINLVTLLNKLKQGCYNKYID